MFLPNLSTASRVPRVEEEIRETKEEYDNNKCLSTTNPLYLCMHMIRVGQARSMKLLSPVICRRRFPRVLNEWYQGMRGYGVGGVQRG